MSPRVGRGFDSSPKLPHTGGKITRLHVLYPFRPLILIYQLPNLQVGIPYVGMTGIASAEKFGWISAILPAGMKRTVAAVTLRNRLSPTVTSVGIGSTVKGRSQ